MPPVEEVSLRAASRVATEIAERNIAKPGA